MTMSWAVVKKAASGPLIKTNHLVIPSTALFIAGEGSCAGLLRPAGRTLRRRTDNGSVNLLRKSLKIVSPESRHRAPIMVQWGHKPLIP